MTDITNQTDPTPTSTGKSDVPKRSRRRTLLISGGAVLAAVVLVGGGVAVGAAVADEIDDDNDATSETAQNGDNQSDESEDGDSDAADAASVAGTASASELLDIIETASAKAEGEPVEIETAADGSWDVQFATSAGDESEVRVDADGNAILVGTEAGDQDNQARVGSLDTATVEALVAAALDDTDGTVIDVEIDGDTASPYDVTVLTADRKTVDIALDSDYTVLTAESDND
ncbi:hypothetical protein ASF62_08640 [Leifsonia sp. Leaf325]|nr:hypothetical protein [Leifsonia sp. Leaf325]KQQ94195.1 hypothetical protein ASF62_08640 [Leifsonia sp. Leaf325]